MFLVDADKNIELLDQIWGLPTGEVDASGFGINRLEPDQTSSNLLKAFVVHVINRIFAIFGGRSKFISSREHQTVYFHSWLRHS